MKIHTSTAKDCRKNAVRRAVSERFYADIRRRVASTVGLLSDPQMQMDRAMNLIDNYLDSGVAPTRGDSLDMLMIFTLLKPELDKAVERSARARRQAEKRRRERLEAGIQAQEPAEMEAGENTTVSAKTADEPAETVVCTDTGSETALFADEFLAVPAVGQGGAEIVVDHGVDVFVEKVREIVGQGELR